MPLLLLQVSTCGCSNGIAIKLITAIGVFAGVTRRASRSSLLLFARTDPVAAPAAAAGDAEAEPLLLEPAVPNTSMQLFINDFHYKRNPKQQTSGRYKSAGLIMVSTASKETMELLHNTPRLGHWLWGAWMVRELLGWFG